MKAKQHPLMVKTPSIHAPALKFLGGCVVAAAIMVGVEGITGVSPDVHSTAPVAEQSWHPAGAMDAVRAYSMYPDDVKFSTLRAGRDGSTCGTAIGTWGVGGREIRHFVYDSTGVSFIPIYYRSHCE